MHDLAILVNACRTGDKDMPPVTVLHHGTPLERHAVFARSIQTVGRIEITDLLRFQAVHCIRIHHHQCLRTGMPSLDARAGNEMGLRCQSFTFETCSARFHHAGITQVDVAHKKPCTNTVTAQRTCLRRQ